MKKKKASKKKAASGKKASSKAKRGFDLGGIRKIPVKTLEVEVAAIRVFGTPVA